MSASAWLLKSPFAHRGLHAGTSCPENSLAAIAAAVEAGYGVEIDVRLARDAVPVVHHDSSLERTANRGKKIHELTSHELSQLSLFTSDQTIPTLSQVFELVSGATPILIEVKNTGSVGELEARTAELIASYSGPVAAMSFNPFVAKWLRENLDRPIGLVSGNLRDWSTLSSWKKVVLRRLWLLNVARPDFVAYELDSIERRLVQRVRRHDRPLFAWTVTSEADLEKATALADNFIFERVRP